jgi:hypothetical protein
MDNSKGFEAHTCAAVLKGIVDRILPSDALITVTREVTFPPLTDALVT